MFCLYFTLLAFYWGTVHGAFSCQEAKKDYSAPVCIQDGYDAFQLPFTDKPNLITVNLGVDSVIGIDEKDFSFTFAGYMNLQWKEPRLEIRNNSHSGLVPVDAGIIEELWLPNVFIYNLKTLEVIEVLSKMTGVWIDEKKDILYSYATHMKIFCSMDFTWFPFDTQVCYFRAGSYSFNDQQMTFTITAAMEKPNTPIELNPLPYSIDLTAEDHLISFAEMGLGNFSVGTASFSFTRKSGPYIPLYFLPSVIFVLISMMSFLVPAEEYTSRLILILLPLLMLQHVYSHVSDIVPRVTVTSMDVWMIASIVVVVLAFLEYIFILASKVHKKSGIVDTMDIDRKCAMVLIPAYIGFIIVYCIVNAA